MNTSLILIGAGGHAKVLLSLIRELGWPILGVCAPELVSQGLKTWRGLEILGSDDCIFDYPHSQVSLVNGVGKKVADPSREQVYRKFKKQGYVFPPLIHPKAWVDSTATLAEGVQVMAGAIIQADACIGENTIINTQASIDHDCKIGAHGHIAPGAVLCGGVQVQDDVYVGANAVIIQGLEIAGGTIIGAGTSMARNVLKKMQILPAQVRQMEL